MSLEIPDIPPSRTAGVLLKGKLMGSIGFKVIRTNSFMFRG